MLVEDLFRGWIEARQTAGMDRDEIAKSLLAWMEDDLSGYCYHLNTEAVKVLDREGCSRRFSPRNATSTPASLCQDYPNSG